MRICHRQSAFFHVMIKRSVSKKEHLFDRDTQSSSDAKTSLKTWYHSMIAIAMKVGEDSSK